MVRVERLLLHKGDANNVLPTAIAYRSVPRYGYCVSYTVPCGVYRDAPMHHSGPIVTSNQPNPRVLTTRYFVYRPPSWMVTLIRCSIELLPAHHVQLGIQVTPEFLSVWQESTSSVCTVLVPFCTVLVPFCTVLVPFCSYNFLVSGVFPSRWLLVLLKQRNVGLPLCLFPVIRCI